jgi:hypothetical protein
MSHAEYDQDKWKAQCGCLEPPPERKATKKTAVKKKSVRNARRKK